MGEPRRTELVFDGDGSEVFALALKTGALTFLTLGIYRFWAKTRLRAYFWSKTRLDGFGLEYTGTGLEKFLGFLAAVVVLAVYLAVVQLVLFGLGPRFLLNPETPGEILGQLLLIYSTFFALLPLIYFAKYRSRRYRLARTKFRGIRFGMTSEAWGYAGRALMYLVLAVLTAGLLHPLMRFRLEKFMTDRTWYGDARLVQGGSWTGLYGSMKHVFIGLGILALAVVCGVMNILAGAVVFGGIGYVWVLVGVFSYYVQGFGYLTRTKRLELAGGALPIGFAAAPVTSKVFWTYILGWMAVGAVAGVVLAMLAQLAVSLEQRLDGAPTEVFLALGVLGYVGFLIFLGAVQMALISRPVLAHFVSTMVVLDADGLTQVRQREAEAGADADGFAEALDVGGAF